MNKVLFVCLGNICRSPLAEEVFRDLAKKAGVEDSFLVDSCGTASYHIGELADSRMRNTAKKHDLVLKHRGRQFARADFDAFDFILVMDKNNFDDVMRMSRSFAQEKKVKYLREFDELAEGSLAVPDPYYGAADGFEEVYQIALRSGQKLLEAIQNKTWA